MEEVDRSPALAGEAKIPYSKPPPCDTGEGDRVSGGRGACSDTADIDKGCCTKPENFVQQPREKNLIEKECASYAELEVA